MAINDQNRSRKTYSFFRTQPKDTAVTTISGGIGINVEGTKSLIIISADTSIVALLSGSQTFSGSVYASGGLTGSLQEVSSGVPYLIAGDYISITTQSNGQVVVASKGDRGADVSASYVTIGNTGSLPNERGLTVGTGLVLIDGGAGSTASIAINDNIVATTSGATFTGPLNAADGLTGSLQEVSSGVPYLVSSGTLTITTRSNGQVAIDNSMYLATLTSDATASAGMTLVDTSGGDVNVCLPNAWNNQGHSFFVKKIDSSSFFTNLKTIDGASQLIDGQAIQSFDAQWTSVHVTASGSNWYIL